MYGQVSKPPWMILAELELGGQKAWETEINFWFIPPHCPEENLQEIFCPKVVVLLMISYNNLLAQKACSWGLDSRDPLIAVMAFLVGWVTPSVHNWHSHVMGRAVLLNPGACPLRWCTVRGMSSLGSCLCQFQFSSSPQSCPALCDPI